MTLENSTSTGKVEEIVRVLKEQSLCLLGLQLSPVVKSIFDGEGGDGSFHCFHDSVQEDLLLSYGNEKDLKSLVHHIPRRC